jgi:beta-exotoxin I transport system ATP-binding protein
VAAITTAGLTKTFGDLAAVDGLDLTVEQGEIFGFLGPNGAGKTTTIRMCLDLARPTAGTITVLGLDSRIGALEIHRRIGYLPGELALPTDLTARQFLDFAGELRPGVDRLWRDELCDRFDVPLDRRIADLSTGNTQKVGLVQAFMHRPDVVFLDEPSRGLDPLVQREFHDLLAEVRARGSTVFLSSHALSEVDRVADRVGILRAGQLVVTDTLDHLRARARRKLELDYDAVPAPADPLAALPGVVSVHTSGTSLLVSVDGPLDAVLRAALGLGTIVNIRAPEADLEEIFLDYYRDPNGGSR